MELRGVNWLGRKKVKECLINKSIEWLLTEKMKIEEGQKTKKRANQDVQRITDMHRINDINSELFNRRKQ